MVKPQSNKTFGAKPPEEEGKKRNEPRKEAFLKSVTQLKSLNDIRTTISTHSRSLPRQKGSTYLDILSRGLEKQRLDGEMDWITRRQHRVEKRIQEIRQLMGNLLAQVDQEMHQASASSTPPGNSRPPAPKSNGSQPGQWKKLTIDY